MDSYRIDEIVRRLLENIPPAVRSVQRDLEANFRAVLRASLGKLDLVTREEFDAQTKVLERTRAKAEALEARVAELERALSGSAARGASGDAGARRAPDAGTAT
jgi:ubiquinone biosynthesis accessory factor UbiK